MLLDALWLKKNKGKNFFAVFIFSESSYKRLFKA